MQGRAKRMGALARMTLAMEGMLAPILPMPSEWTRSAPFCLPRPTASILQGPLS